MRFNWDPVIAASECHLILSYRPSGWPGYLDTVVAMWLSANYLVVTQSVKDELKWSQTHRTFSMASNRVHNVVGKQYALPGGPMEKKLDGPLIVDLFFLEVQS